MCSVSIVFHSGMGHTKKMAEARKGSVMNTGPLLSLAENGGLFRPKFASTRLVI